MHTELYRHLSAARGKASDEHVACMSGWVRNSADAAYTKKCQSTALRYKQSLDKELAYLQKRPASPNLDRRISLIKGYLDLVAKDLTMLTQH